MTFTLGLSRIEMTSSRPMLGYTRYFNDTKVVQMFIFESVYGTLQSTPPPDEQIHYGSGTRFVGDITLKYESEESIHERI
ncbi:hypothetical protein BLOT_006105 [Blomia tropicalis]|nr:hypothetical protein BLOT_006105 [Blomia tropicalis]